VTWNIHNLPGSEMTPALPGLKISTTPAGKPRIDVKFVSDVESTPASYGDSRKAAEEAIAGFREKFAKEPAMRKYVSLTAAQSKLTAKLEKLRTDIKDLEAKKDELAGAGEDKKLLAAIERLTPLRWELTAAEQAVQELDRTIAQAWQDLQGPANRATNEALNALMPPLKAEREELEAKLGAAVGEILEQLHAGQMKRHLLVSLLSDSRTMLNGLQQPA
jgi:chromosome segregation ATPase